MNYNIWSGAVALSVFDLFVHNMINIFIAIKYTICKCIQLQRRLMNNIVLAKACSSVRRRFYMELNHIIILYYILWSSILIIWSVFFLFARECSKKMHYLHIILNNILTCIGTTIIHNYCFYIFILKTDLHILLTRTLHNITICIQRVQNSKLVNNLVIVNTRRQRWIMCYRYSHITTFLYIV